MLDDFSERGCVVLEQVAAGKEGKEGEPGAWLGRGCLQNVDTDNTNLSEESSQILATVNKKFTGKSGLSDNLLGAFYFSAFFFSL